MYKISVIFKQNLYKYLPKYSESMDTTQYIGICTMSGALCGTWTWPCIIYDAEEGAPYWFYLYFTAPI